MGRKKDGWRRLLAVLMVLLLQPLTRTRLGMCVQNIDVLVSTVNVQRPQIVALFLISSHALDKTVSEAMRKHINLVS